MWSFLEVGVYSKAHSIINVAVCSDMRMEIWKESHADKFGHGVIGRLGGTSENVTAEISRSQMLQAGEITDPTKAARLCQCHRSMMQVSGSNYTSTCAA